MKHACAILAIAATLRATAALAQAPQPSSHEPDGGGRTLGSHTFVLSSMVPAPFTGTYLQTSTGGAMAFDIVEPIVVDIGGTQDTLIGSGSIALGSLGIVYQQRVTRRFAIAGGVSGSFRTGTQARMIVAEGLSGLAGLSIGALAEVSRGPAHLITATLDYRNVSLTEITPQDFAQYVGDWGIDSIEHWGEHFVQSRRSNRVVGGGRAAFTLKPWLGINAALEAGPGNLSESGSKLVYSAGANVSFDVRPLKPAVPVGLFTSYSRTNAPQKVDDIFGTASTWGIGLSYTGRRDFTIGLDVQLSRLELVSTSQNVTAAAGRIILRYDF